MPPFSFSPAALVLGSTNYLCLDSPAFAKSPPR